MNTINLGKVRGNMIYTGGAVVGSSAAGVIFDATGIEKAYEGDIYINLDSSSIYNGNVYECVTPGSPDIAKWIYKGSIRGPKVSTVNNLKSTSTEDALAAYQGTRLFDMMINAGVFSKNVIVDCDQIVYGLKVVIDNVDSVLTLVVGGIEYKYNHISSGTAENTKISIVLGENIGMPQSGGVINEIRSTEAYIYAYELTDASATTIYSKNINLWDAINEALLSHEITGQVIDGEETLAMGSIHKFVNGLKKVFYPITHAKAVWFDKANKKTVHDVITEMLSGSDSGNISDEYDENVIYEAGAYCIRENVLYKALGTTTGEFDANMWEACKVDEEIGVLKNDVSELNKNIIKNNLGTAVEMTGTWFECPSDGYLSLYAHYGSNYVYAEIRGNDEANALLAYACSIDTASSSQNIFVRKGIRLRRGNISETTNSYARFIPLE